MAVIEQARNTPLICKGMFPDIISGDAPPISSALDPHLDCSHNPLCTGSSNTHLTFPSPPRNTVCVAVFVWVLLEYFCGRVTPTCANTLVSVF